MKIAGSIATVFLSEDGGAVLKVAGIHLSNRMALAAWIEESEDLGLWVRITRQDQPHLFLLRWEYILGIDLPSGLGKVVGLKG